MNFFHYILIASIYVDVSAAQEFAYMKEFDLFQYLEEPRGGLALFPVPGNRETLLKWADEKESLRVRVKNNEHKDADVEQLAGALLESKNYLGFIHFSAALAKTGREADFFKIYKTFFNNDKRRNFSVLYGLYVMKDIAGADSEKLLNESTKNIIMDFKKTGFKVAKTIRFPDLISTMLDSSK